MAKETKGFQTEVKQLLHLVIHSLYSNKEIFLRELISNAADACDKLRLEAMRNDKLYEKDPDLHIRISYDKEAHTITVSDNGIGMTYDQVIDHIGTIAKSGTKEFMSKLTGDATKDASLIGQFGVGFYSSFIVADKVEIKTRYAGEPAEAGVYWVSDGVGEYTIENMDKESRGTDVILHLRHGEEEMLTQWWIRRVINKYSDYILIPIEMRKETWDPDKNENVITDEWERVNEATAIWARPKSEVTDEQYNEFYKHIAHDFEGPLAHVHAHVEGKLDYTMLLFIPKHPPFDLFDRQKPHGVQLFVKRVFIMDDAEQLIPNYLRFVRGIVDSADLPLNVSREILQESRDVKAIREGCTKRVLGLIQDLSANDPEKFQTFWKAFGSVLKEGVGEDAKNKNIIARLLRFASTLTDKADPTVSLDEYVNRMKAGQDKIYYITADSFLAAKNSPHLEVFRKKGIEVLLLTEKIDEWVVSYLTEFDGKPLQSVTKGSLDLPLDEEEKEQQSHVEEDNKELIEKIKEDLKDNVQDVRISMRLTDSPACLVADEKSMGANLERILKAAGQPFPTAKPIMEINPNHVLIKRMKEQDDKTFNEWAHVLFDQALLAEGGQLDDPATFVKRINSIILNK